MHGVSWRLTHLFAPIENPLGFLLAAVLATLFFVGVMAVLHRLSPQAKKWMTIICTFVAGLYFLLDYFWPVHPLPDGSEGNFITPTIEHVSIFITVVFAWTILLGVISLSIVNGRRLFKLLPGWHNSLAFFLAMIAIVVFGLWSEMGLGPMHPKLLQSATNIYESLYSGLLVNLDAAMFSLLAFYIASAAYRAFRVRTVEAGLLMVAALIVMLGMLNLGAVLTNFIPEHSMWAALRLEQLTQWMMKYLNMPGQRAVLIGVQVGALAMALRLWLSLERGAFFSQEK